jgi:hypothetical protein
MGQRIDQFCEDLRLKLTSIDGRVDDLKGRIDEKAENAEQDVRNHLGQVQKRIEQDRAKVSAAQGKVKDWVESRKTATADKIAGWKAKRETARLQQRADDAEAYASATVALAVAAIDEAELAAVEAWLARLDADSGARKESAELGRQTGAGPAPA